MSRKNGFTLMEILFVVLFVSIFSILFIPNTLKMIENHQTNLFFELLNTDILFIQNQSLGSVSNIRIMFYADHYLIMYDHDLFARREYPNHLTYSTRSNNRITFNSNGTAINPSTYRFKDKDKSYQIVVPLGKGRHYIEEL